MTTIDAEALRARYRLERDKRLRPEGNAQYVEPPAGFLVDPWTAPFERDAVDLEVEVAVVGAGFAGLLNAARLKEAGVDDVWLIDGAGDVGGAWYWNRYPGAMCDTAAMIYLPLLEETGHMPSMKYTQAPEIFGHARRIAHHYGLYEKALLSTEVRSLVWEDGRWTVTTDRGDRIRARFVVTGTGPLHRPKLPGIDGVLSFAGKMFHTSRWDYAFTGGDDQGAPMDALANLRVGIIGTGATGIQCIPRLAEAAGELFVFQRTPSSVDVRGNRSIDPEWFATLTPGWQQRWITNFATLQTGGFTDEDLVMDGWTDIAQRIRDRVVVLLAEPGAVFDADLIRRAYEASDDEKMTEIRARVDAVVSDPATAEGLKAWYRQMCKRPCFHDEYLDAYNREHVHLVHTDGRGVDRIDETGVWVDGEHYDLDLIIFASGFEVNTEHARRAGFETVGRDGVTLTEHWSDGMRTLHGIHSWQFPNLFLMAISQGGQLLSNVPHNFTETSRAVAAVVQEARRRGPDCVVEVTEEAEAAWIDLLLNGGRPAFVGDPECTPGYYNNEGGEVEAARIQTASGYPGGPVAFFEFLEAWRNSGGFEGLRFEPAP